MQLSHFLKIYPYEEKPGYFLLFSTKRSSVIVIKEETFQAIEQGTLSPEDEALLTRHGVIVPDREEEKRNMFDLVDKKNARNPVVNSMVVLNLDCNFACLYCYEGDMKGNLYMSDETAALLINLIKKNFTGEKKKLLIDFYGGEPLLSLGLIKSISRELQAFAQEKGGSFTFTLVTNGALFKRQTAEELVPLGLERIKITLDGPADVHNHYRPFKSGVGSFDTLIKNIKETCDLVKINIGGNFESHNYEQFVSLLDFLMKEKLTPEKIGGIKFDPVSKRPEGDLSPADYNEGCMSMDEPWLIKASEFLREEILKRGYNTPKIAPIFCMVDNESSFVVNFDGVIYKCPAFIGKQGFAVGDVRNGIDDYTNSYKLGLWKSHEECAECVYLPLCFGGCRYTTFIQQGTLDALECRKKYLDATLETFIKQEVKYK
jgi:Arylsulfatase regulator (Fe-S oxidoreductase)